MAAELERNGIAMVAISYDSPATLREFRDQHGIEYLLLGDEDSVVITDLGLLDRDLDEHHHQFGMPVAQHQRGVAYPAMFLLDEDGKVVARRIHDNYRTRDGGLVLLEEMFGLRHPARGTPALGETPKVQVSVTSDRGAYSRWQRTRVHVRLDIAPGWHVYSEPVPDGYVALGVEVSGDDGLEVGTPVQPQPHEYRVAGLPERFLVHDGEVEVVIPIALHVDRDHGEVRLQVAVEYQACDAGSCLAPVRLEFPLVLAEMVVA